MLDKVNELINSIATGSFYFNKPEILFLILPILLILILVLVKSFVAIDKRRLSDKGFLKSRRRYRVWLFFTRALIFTALIVALADPFGEVKKDVPGDLTVTMLTDNSTSMELFNTGFVPTLKAELEKKLPTKTSVVAIGLESAIGDGILSNIEKDKNILLISDGQATSGTSMPDVMLYAASLNSSVSAIKLDTVKNDFGVSIKGPSKTIADVENQYKVKVQKIGTGISGKAVRLTIGVDDEVVYDDLLAQDDFVFTKNFSSGYHKIVARISPEGDDYFANNNVFYKTTHVIPKPKVLLVTTVETPLKQILDELYEVTQVNTLPDSEDELSPYYAVILNDLPIDKLRDVKALSNFVVEGNGLFVIGGYNSFDNGGYKGTAFESLLPVQVGTGGMKQGDSNIVVVIDISGSFTERGVETTALKTSKSMAYDTINNINEKNSVGVVAFDEFPYLVAQLEPLFVSKAQTLEKVSRLQGTGGQTDFSAGLKGAFNLLRGRTGSKNIIFISDGFTWSKLIQQDTLDVVKAMHEYGIRIYTIGVGRNLDEPFLRQMTTYGGGIYFNADTSNRLQILFGEAEKKEVGSAFGLFVIDPYHFITEDLETNAVLYGYNQVVPKSSANLLITTDSGEPALVAWRHGIGRVASLSAFSGGNNLGELLNRDNSRLLTRTINWVIADPERKNDFFVDIPDARAGKPSEIIVRSSKYPNIKGLEFSRVDRNTYRTTYVNPDVGFKMVLNAIYGVNYDREYQDLGYNTQLGDMVSATNGKTFTPEQVNEIVEHVQTVSRRTVVERQSFMVLFILLALAILTLEILGRRIRDTWFRR